MENRKKRRAGRRRNGSRGTERPRKRAPGNRYGGPALRRQPERRRRFVFHAVCRRDSAVLGLFGSFGRFPVSVLSGSAPGPAPDALHPGNRSSRSRSSASRGPGDSGGRVGGHVISRRQLKAEGRSAPGCRTAAGGMAPGRNPRMGWSRRAVVPGGASNST